MESSTEKYKGFRLHEAGRFGEIIIVTCLSSCIQDIPTLLPVDPFDPNSDAARLYDAMDGLGTDEDKVVSVLCYRTASQRDAITISYNNQHGVSNQIILTILQWNNVYMSLGYLNIV